VSSVILPNTPLLTIVNDNVESVVFFLSKTFDDDYVIHFNQALFELAIVKLPLEGFG
jgi:hypothetical protein